MTRLGTIMSLGRTKFLCYSPLLYGIGAALATAAGAPVRPGSFLLGQLLVFCTHLMTHYYNEYFDFDTDALNANPSPWTGGSRVLPSGALPPWTAVLAGRATLIGALALTLLLPSLLAQVISCGAIILAWGYSGPPLKLSRRGLGELTTTAVLNGLTPLLGFVLQGGHEQPGLSATLAAVLAPLALIEYVRMMVMNMPDREADAAVGKNTLIVKLGMRRSVGLYAAGMAAAYLAIPVLFFAGPLPAAVCWALLLSLPLAALSAARVIGGWRDPRRFFTAPYWASTHNGVAAWLALAGCVAMRPAGSLARPATQLVMFGLYLYPLAVGYLAYRASAARRPAGTPARATAPAALGNESA